MRDYRPDTDPGFFFSQLGEGKKKKKILGNLFFFWWNRAGLLSYLYEF